MAQSGSVQELENLCGVDQQVRLFRELIAYDTTSDPVSRAVPSSLGQLRLGAYLAAQCSAMDYEVKTSSQGVVTVSVPPSEGCEHKRSLCLLAHLDTSPDARGAGISPELIRDYQGEGIRLRNGLILNEQICPALSSHHGDDLIVTDGTTLLGADDKAGVAILLSMLHDLKLSGCAHGPLKCVFTVDEEIGLSSQYVEVDKLGCDFGLTVDGGDLGGLDVATFNASAAEIRIQGRSIHPGGGYKKLVNASMLVSRLLSSLPSDQLPETTQGKEGFYHVTRVQSSCEMAEISLIMRDFTETGLQRREQYLLKLAALMNEQYGYEAVTLSIKPQYRNLSAALDGKPEILDYCRRAFERAGVSLHEEWVRGGTDGSNLSFRGLPSPNLFTGALNCHGVYECLSLRAFRAAFAVVQQLVKVIAEEA